MKTSYNNAKIYNSRKKTFENANMLVENGIITNIGEKIASDVAQNFDDCYIIPGFVDVHTHGRASYDFVNADTKALGIMQSSYLESGVTTALPTLATASFEQLILATNTIEEYSKNCTNNIFAGVHLEGRYLNPNKRGAHKESLLSPLVAKEIGLLVSEMKKVGKAHVTAALELDFDGSFFDTATKQGATFGLGHTEATYEQSKELVKKGVVSFTHLYNAMPPLHHRDGGVVCAGFDSPDVFCELIVDGLHVCPEMVNLAYKIKKDKIVLITDSMEATCCADGEYSIAGMPVTVKNSIARTHDGALAGSTLSMLDGVKNLARFANISFEQAVYHATATPAEMIGLYDKVGSLEVGKQADFVVLSKNYDIIKVFKGNG